MKNLKAVAAALMLTGLPTLTIAQAQDPAADATVQRAAEEADREDRGEWGWIGLLGLLGLLGLRRRDRETVRTRP